jgi:prolyl 4-hydroxylase
MEPGDMVLYESHSVLHGRPFPLEGRFMANIFIHFEPTGHSLRHNMKLEELKDQQQDVNAKYKRDLARGVGGHEVDAADLGLPPYIIPGSPEESNWRRSHPEGFNSKHKDKVPSSTTGSTLAHQLAQEGAFEDLKQVLSKDKSLVHVKDVNGWTPIHEGVRSGQLEVVKLLVEHGADVNATTRSGESPLDLAKRMYEDSPEEAENDPIVEFLIGLGAITAGPDL